MTALGVSPAQLGILERFFKDTLAIEDASWKDIVENLKWLRNNWPTLSSPFTALYEYLDKMDLGPSVFELRRAFENNALIFTTHRGTPEWWKSSECLWSSAAEIGRKIPLSEQYPGLRSFFVDKLGVKTVSLQIIHDELLQVNSKTPVGKAKSLLLSFSALIQSDRDSELAPGALLKVPVFPVKLPTGDTSLKTFEASFLIVDRESLVAQFNRRIKVADFTLEEVGQLKTFFTWMGMEDRYISASVQEVTRVSSDNRRTISSPGRDLKRKAYYILRIAATFGSPRYSSDDPSKLYKLLRQTEVLETDGIASVLKISQDGETIEVEESRCDLHTNETDGGLEIYVPNSKDSQEYIYSLPLPTRLAEWLMRERDGDVNSSPPKAMVTALTATLNCSSTSALDRVLDHQGILPVSLRREDMAIEEPLTITEEADGEGDVSSGAMITRGSWTSRGNPKVPDDSDGFLRASSSMLVQTLSRRANTSFFAGSPRVGAPRVSPSHEGGRYLALLDRVIRAARQATFPPHGAFNMSSLLGALSGGGEVARFDGFGAMSRFQSDSQHERDKKVGAAGELYVFELLSALQPALAGWSRANWQSTIREYVSIHPDYADMPSWSGMETADITYRDMAGQLTSLLIGKGYLDQQEWENARPRYFIEVKTTTGACGTPFYISKHQYQRMRDTHNSGGKSDIYVIFRVFGIFGERVGGRVYLDPEQAKLDGELLFTGELWSVTLGPEA